MPEIYPWYTTVEGEELQQGDFLDRCPIIMPAGDIPENGEAEAQLEGEKLIYNVIIISQSCDLAYDKIAFVHLCPCWSLEDFGEKEGYFKGYKGKEELRRGNVPGYHMLASCEIAEMIRGIQVVDLRLVFSLPLAFLKRFAARKGMRLRLLPPYREHLSQAFARLFMRVGLPSDIPEFRKT